MVSFHARITERTNNFIIIFIKICKYLNLVKKSEDDFNANKKFPSYYI